MDYDRSAYSSKQDILCMRGTARADTVSPTRNVALWGLPVIQLLSRLGVMWLGKLSGLMVTRTV